jgi:hypothetical protein
MIHSTRRVDPRIRLVRFVARHCGVPTAERVTDSLSCEGIWREALPARYRAALTAFRHLRQDARLALVRRALAVER